MTDIMLTPKQTLKQVITNNFQTYRIFNNNTALKYYIPLYALNY